LNNFLITHVPNKYSYGIHTYIPVSWSITRLQFFWILQRTSYTLSAKQMSKV
jgi:hypothetical protein